MARITRHSAIAVLLASSVAASAMATAQPGTWLVRAGASVVHPKADNLALAPGTTLQIDATTRPTFDVTYLFREHWGVELLVSTFWKHELRLRSPAGTTRLGEIKHLPPTVSLQYHFNPRGRVRPYAGLGVNYTHLFDEVPPSLRVDDSLGLAAQIGLDVGITERWFVNLSARYIDIHGDARLGATDIGRIEVDPIVYGVHVGLRLGH